MTPDNKDDQFDDGLDQFDEVPDDSYEADDFAPEGSEDDGFVEEDWDSYDDKAQDDGEGDQDQAPAKKKSGNFNKIVIGVAILIGAGIFVMQFGGGTAPAPTNIPANAPAVASDVPAPAAPSPAPVAESMPAPAPVQAGSQPATEPGGFLGSAGGLAALEQDIAKSYENSEMVEEGPAEVDNAVTPPMPTAITPEVATEPAVSERASVENAGQAGAEAPIRMPKANEILLKQPAASAPVLSGGDDLAATPVSPVVTEAPMQADVSTELVAKMDQLLARLGQLESDVATLKNNNNENNNQADIAEQIGALQKSMKALEQKTESAPAVTPSRPAVEKPRESQPEMTQSKPQILGSPSAANDSGSVATAPKAVKKAPIQWVLKGAQPGRAMVSQPGESDMRSVAVGDTLPGIGKITAISYVGGRWQVVGTQGVIHQ